MQPTLLPTPINSRAAGYAQTISAAGFVTSPYLKVWDPTGRTLVQQSWTDAAFTAPFSGDYPRWTSILGVRDRNEWRP